MILPCALIATLCVANNDRSFDRPWTLEISLETDLDDRVKAAKDAAAIVAAAEHGMHRGLMPNVAVLDGRLDVGGEPLAAALGLTKAGDTWKLVDAASFREAPPTPVAKLVPLSGRDRSDLLKGRYRELKLANKSTYFDLWSDLSANDIQPYTDDLNTFYRNLRNQFRAHLLGNIEVVLYGNRSDYLLGYARSFGKSGEHVLGYYVPSLRRLYFYDDRYQREEVLETARHECTHLLIDLGFNRAPIPPWLHEGLACYMAAGGAGAAGEYAAGLVYTLQQERKRNRTIGIDDLLQVTSKTLEYKHYAWSWSLVHYLNEDGNAKEFQEFLSRLRESVNEETKLDDCRSQTASLFLEVFGGSGSQIEFDWLDYFDERFRITAPERYLDFGYKALWQARFGQYDDDRRRYLDTASECFARAPEDVEPPLMDREFGRLATMVARAEIEGFGLRPTLLLLRELREGLPSVGGLADESRKVDLIRRALRVLRAASGVKGSVGDLRAGLLKQVQSAQGQEKDERRAGVALLDELLESAYAMLAGALADNPLHQPAAHEWLVLSHDIDGARLREVFDYLQVQNEKDPDDRNTAALGLAYVDLGKKKFGREMIKRAQRRSLRPGELVRYASRAGIE